MLAHSDIINLLMYWKQIGITNDDILSYRDIFHNIVSWLKNQYPPLEYMFIPSAC